MNIKPLINGEVVDASLETTLAIEQFLNDNYLFRRNVLNGKVEFLIKDEESVFRPLTPEALNSIIRKAKKENVCEKGSPKTEITEFVYSEDVPSNNPIKEYPSVEINQSNRIRIGLAMKALGYESTDHSNVPFYKVIPLKVA